MTGAVRVLDGLDDTGAQRLVLEQDRAVDVEHDEQVLGGDRRVFRLTGDALDDLGRLLLLHDLDAAGRGQMGFTHATGSRISSPPRYGRSTSGTTTDPSAR